MATLYRHQRDGTYYTRIYRGGIVTRQIHPDGVAYLKHNGVSLFGDIPSQLMSELHERNWLFTKEEMHCRGEIDWSPHWHLIDLPKPKPFPSENPFVTRQRERERAAAEAEKRAKEEAEQQKEEAKREARREQRRKYRARKRAEAEAAEARRVAKREQQRNYRARKKAEAEAARLAAQPSTLNPVEMQDGDVDATLPVQPTTAISPPVKSEETEYSHTTDAKENREAKNQWSSGNRLWAARDMQGRPTALSDKASTAAPSTLRVWLWIAIALVILLAIAATMLLS